MGYKFQLNHYIIGKVESRVEWALQQFSYLDHIQS